MKMYWVLLGKHSIKILQYSQNTLNDMKGVLKGILIHQEMERKRRTMGGMG